jgi:hypothetical protein
MNTKDLDKFLSDNNLTSGDLARILFNSSEMTDRVIISRWLNGVVKIPRWLPNRLKSINHKGNKSELELYLIEQNK